MRVTYGAGGWVRVEARDLPGPLFLRLEADSRGRHRVKDLLLRGDWRHLVAADLRELNLAAIEEWLQVDVDVFGSPGLGPEPSMEPFGETWGPLADWKDEVERSVAPLQRPTRGLTDEFLTHVRDAYRQAVANGQKPAPTLAKQVGDGATDRTIHKWVATARQRGIMAPAARRGSV